MIVKQLFQPYEVCAKANCGHLNSDEAILRSFSSLFKFQIVPPPFFQLGGFLKLYFFKHVCWVGLKLELRHWSGKFLARNSSRETITMITF